MFNYYEENLNQVYPKIVGNCNWEIVGFCESEEVDLEYLVYSLRTSKKVG